MRYGMIICKSIEDKDDDGYCWSVGEYNEQLKQQIDKALDQKDERIFNKLS